MKKRVKVLSVLVAAITVMTNICAYASSIHVKLDGLTKENEVLNVDFEDVLPITADGISMVPVRPVCDDAGMNVMWQKSFNAVVVKLSANEHSDLPIEEYAYKLLTKKMQSVGRKLIPECIIVTMYLNSEEAMLHYNYKDGLGMTVSYGKILNLPKSLKMIENGTIGAPLRTVFNQFGLLIEWDCNNKEIVIKIPETVEFAYGLEEFDAYYPQADECDNKVYLGKFKITHYCACSKCCGPYVGKTAWGGKLTPGYTIAVDPSVIGKLSKVIIDGYGIRVAEDCGGAIKGNRIDVAVSSHEEALALGVVYKDVWVVAE